MCNVYILWCQFCTRFVNKHAVIISVSTAKFYISSLTVYFEGKFYIGFDNKETFLIIANKLIHSL